ncbi:MAG: cytochrome c3 family protein [Desulfobacterales bacterium]
MEKCLHCHKYIIANHPWIKKEHEYFNTNTPTPWIKLNYVAEHVLFNHQRHINSKIACTECHGQVQNLQRLPQKIWYMGECIECHRKKNANLDCWLACHS